MIAKVEKKWGFGMAPVKPKTNKERDAACEGILRLLASGQTPSPQLREDFMDEASTVKGLFMRIVREDQWDWFTVAGQLGYPSRRISKVIADEMVNLRTAIKFRDAVAFSDARVNLLRLPTRKCLKIHLGREKLAEKAGAGWIYVLSHRDTPELLKVGMTNRSVEERAREINNATGVAIPFGVRRCWRVVDASKAEKLAHKALREFRVREDREFFRVSFSTASKLLGDIIRKNKLEIRTLDALDNLTHPG